MRGGQYRDIAAWKCNKCGRVLQTEKGLERHRNKCRYAEPVLEGQMTLTDAIDAAQTVSARVREPQHDDLEPVAMMGWREGAE